MINSITYTVYTSNFCICDTVDMCMSGCYMYMSVGSLVKWKCFKIYDNCRTRRNEHV